MKATYIQPGETLDFVNTGSAAISAGDVVTLDSRIGVAGCDIAAGGTGTVHVVGVFEIAKKASEALTVGKTVYYSAVDGITATEAGNTLAGFVIEAAAANAEAARVKIG